MAYETPDQGITLGAWRRSKAGHSSPDRETLYWLPCSGQVDGVEWPHCLFIVSSLAPHVLCPACRKAAETKASPQGPPCHSPQLSLL